MTKESRKKPIDTKFWLDLVKSRSALILMMLFSVVLLFNDLSQPGLPAYDDCTKAQRGWEMLQSGDYLTPRIGGNENWDHPPFFFWFIALAFKIWGKTEFAARFSGSLFALITILVVYLTGKEIKNRETGWWAAVFLSSTYIFLKIARRVNTDVPFMLFATLSLFFFIKAASYLENGNSTASRRATIYFILFGLSTGAAGLIKSVFIIFPLLSPVFYMLLKKMLKKQLILRYLAGCFIATLVTGSWFVIEYIKYKDRFLKGFIDTFLVPHTRGASGLGGLGPLGYLYEIGRHFWPWLPLIIWAIWMIYIRKKPAIDGKVLILTVHILFPLIVLSFFGDKTIRYILFLFPPLLILTSLSVVSNLSENTRTRCIKYTIIFLMVLCSFLIIRPFDFENPRSEDYVMLRELRDREKIDLKGKEIYHFSGEYGSEAYPLLFYMNIKLKAILSENNWQIPLASQNKNWCLLINKNDLTDEIKRKLKIVYELKTKYLMAPR